MTSKTKKPTPTQAPASATRVAKFDEKGADPAEAAAVAKFVLRPSVNAAVVISDYGKGFGELNLTALIDSLTEGVEAVNNGDMARAEAMLYAQAHALQAMFMNLSRRALKQEYQRNFEAVFRMAMKAQSQCRATLETLAAIKNPPVVFARQANINNGGQQQVNNGQAPAKSEQYVQAGAHADKPKLDQTELLEAAGHGQRLDTGTAGAAGCPDPHMATMGGGNRATHRRGQGDGGAQR